MRPHVLAAALTAALIALSSGTAGAVPEQLGLTARLTDDGVALEGNHAIILRIHDAATAGTAVWTETKTATVEGGLVYLTLGDDTPLDADVLDGGPLWIEIQVDGTVLTPRLAITSAAYAVRAGVAENAEMLGGQPASAYLPVGAALACAGGQKVTGLSPTGSVACAADIDTTYTAAPGLLLSGTQFSPVFAGSGTASSIARSDHDHAGTYLPLAGSGRTCSGTQKVTAVNSDGTVTCAADVDTDTDTNTTYSNGTGLLLNGSQFSVSFPASGGNNGVSNSVARADHRHPVSCPAPYATAQVPGQNTVMCALQVSGAPISWYSAGRACFGTWGGAHLCDHDEVMAVRSVLPNTAISADTWLGDRVADDWALYVSVAISSGSTDNFDGQSNITTDNHSNYLCCMLRNAP